jgi:hypothetical protein
LITAAWPHPSPGSNAVPVTIKRGKKKEEHVQLVREIGSHGLQDETHLFLKTFEEL